MGNITYEGSRPVLQLPRKPTAAVLPARFVDDVGDQLAVAGARAHGISTDEHTTTDLAIAAKELPVGVIGTYSLELGGTVGNNAFVTSDNVGRGVAPTAGQAINAFIRKGGAIGDIVEAEVFLAPGVVASAFIADPAGGTTIDAEARTAINAINDLLIAQGLMASS
jgi:hypothetical protein